MVVANSKEDTLKSWARISNFLGATTRNFRKDTACGSMAREQHGMCELGRLGKDWARPESGMGTAWCV